MSGSVKRGTRVRGLCGASGNMDREGRRESNGIERGVESNGVESNERRGALVRRSGARARLRVARGSAVYCVYGVGFRGSIVDGTGRPTVRYSQSFRGYRAKRVSFDVQSRAGSALFLFLFQTVSLLLVVSTARTVSFLSFSSRDCTVHASLRRP